MDKQTTSLTNIPDEKMREAVIMAFDRLFPEGEWTVEAREVTVAVPKSLTEKRWIAYFRPKAFHMEFVLIPKGTFTMGSAPHEEGREYSEGPQREVEIGRPFLMGAMEVTQADWEAVMGYNSSYFKFLGGDHPVERISWHDAVAFCGKVSDRLIHTCRLPTEAEWEYACRAGTTTRFSCGDTISTDLANYGGRRRKGDYRRKTSAVGSFPANAWGLYHMHGNVWEWCQDWWEPRQYHYWPNFQLKDPKGPDDGAHRVRRGGSWDAEPECCRSASRGVTLDSFSYNTGFRVVVSVASFH